jgi:hypothetical protein
VETAPLKRKFHARLGGNGRLDSRGFTSVKNVVLFLLPVLGVVRREFVGVLW